MASANWRRAAGCAASASGAASLPRPSRRARPHSGKTAAKIEDRVGARAERRASQRGGRRGEPAEVGDVGEVGEAGEVV